MRGKALDTISVQQLITLRKSGLSLNEISRRTSIPKSTVQTYIKDIQLSPLQKKRLRDNTARATAQSNHARKGKFRKYRIAPETRWTRNLVECLAHFQFDGSIQQYQLSYANRSASLIGRQRELVKICFGIQGTMRQQKSGVYQLQFYSTDLAEIVSRLVGDLEKQIRTSPKEWQRIYLRAFFDDEGNVDVAQNGRIRVRGYQHDVQNLKLVQELLNSFGIPSSLDQTAMAVVIQGKSNLRRFHQEINFSKGIFMNHLRKNSRYQSPIGKADLLANKLAETTQPQ